MASIREGDSELTNVKDVQTIKLNTLVTIAFLNRAFAPGLASFIGLDLSKEDKTIFQSWSPVSYPRVYCPIQKGAERYV